MKYIPLIAALIFSPASAETNVSPSEFEALSTGKTLYFSKDGKSYGAEHFYKGHRSKWRYSDGNCEDGVWFTHEDLFCFNYEGGTETQCWTFFKTEKGFAARSEGAPFDEILELDLIDNKPLLCKSDGLSV
jgi:hypothetical protein